MGIEQLERQQLDREKQRLAQEQQWGKAQYSYPPAAEAARPRTATNSSALTLPRRTGVGGAGGGGHVVRANPFEDLVPRGDTVPSTVHLEGGNDVDDEETLDGGGLRSQTSLEEGVKKKLKRATSFGKMLKTPLVGRFRFLLSFVGTRIYTLGTD